MDVTTYLFRIEFITTSREAHLLIHEGYRYVEIMKQEQKYPLQILTGIDGM